ncbi:GtrA family protein [Neobacillus notoginsengisoli]|uniref:GtrA family protein n=1 Tax=Neobacillus notoginsengisoli TaxID=1578198 RepID=A0A417YXU0_9BACI|nr:GtrA family protein [Neobacillus notoginsengisoli]RHW42602.1 GtrA family protein [Neobacillus notoginsengisoli]
MEWRVTNLIPANTLKRTSPFIRFALVGVVNTAAGLFIMLFLLNVFSVSYWLSTFTGNVVGAVISYFLNKAFTFESSVRFREGAPRFLAVILGCYFMSYWLSGRIVDAGAVGFLPREWADNAAVLIGSVFYTVSNYFGQKKIVFRQRENN